jgi:putative spermidine/putrescine transport system ATP-binding protein
MARGAALPITLRQISKSYGRVRALDGVDLDVRSGEFLTLLGPSGSGKTTLLMVLAGFTRPDHGTLLFGDQEVIRLAPHKRELGMVFQNYALFPHMSVAGNIAFPLRLRRLPRPQISDRVERVLETVKLGGYGDRRVDQLSGGQRQRVALARAIVFEPRILLMDEPLSALDKQLREHMQVELRELHDRLGITTIYVTHDQREALTMSDRIAVVSEGRIIQLGEPRAIYERPATRFVAEFIGESAFLPVRVSEGGCFFADEPIRLSSAPRGQGPRLLMFRPERLHLLAEEPTDGMNVLHGVAAGVIYQGESFILRVALSDGSRVNLRGMAGGRALAALPQPGDAVRLGLSPDDGLLLDPADG